MKRHVMMTIEEEIIDVHKQLGSNISKLCNDFLAGYCEESTKKILTFKKKEVKNLKKLLKKGQKQAQNDQKTTVFEQNIYMILAKAKQKRGLGKDFGYLIDQAVEESGLSRAEVVTEMEKIRL